MSRHLSTSIAHPLDTIDPFLDASRDDGEARMTALRSALRLFARSVESTTLLTRESDSSIGALIASKRGAGLGAQVLDSIMSSSAVEKATACLVCPTTKVVSAEEADGLPEELRMKCIPISGCDTLATPTDEPASSPHVVLTIPKEVCGGARDGKMDVERNRVDTIKISIVSSSGARKVMHSGIIPTAPLDRLFDRSISKGHVGPTRKSMCKYELPDYIKLGIVDFLERRIRLQVLCTASVPAPTTRPVALDGAHLKQLGLGADFDKKQKNWLQVCATLHPSSSSCLCGAHGLRFEWKGSVEVKMETCGRPLQETPDGAKRCPCHVNALDDKGNSRFSIDGYCTEDTTLSVTCFHRQDRFVKRGVSIEPKLSDADRLELSTLLMAMCEFEARTAPFFHKRWATNQSEIDKFIAILHPKLTERLSLAHMKQLENEDADIHNPRAMLQRDMTSVDLMRGGGVFRHRVKGGPNKGKKEYLRRAKNNTDTKPLTEYESDLVYTHGHLFRKSI